MKFTPLQILGAALVVNGALTGSVNELTDLFGGVWAKHILSVCEIASAICGGLVMMMGGQGAMIQNVAAMPGVSEIKVNRQANATLATLAVSNNTKIAPVAEDVGAVANTAARG